MHEDSLASSTVGSTFSAHVICLRDNRGWRDNPNSHHNDVYRTYIASKSNVSDPRTVQIQPSRRSTQFGSKQVLTFVRTEFYNYISAFWVLSSVGGSAIGSVLLSHHVWLLNALSVLCFILAACLATAIPSDLGKDSASAEDTRPIIMASDATDIQRTSLESDSFRREETTKVLHCRACSPPKTNYALAFLYWYSPTFMACIVPIHTTSFPATISHFHSHRHILAQRSCHKN